MLAQYVGKNPTHCQACVDRLTEKDSPSLETIKLQVEFESAFLREHTKIEESQRQSDYSTTNLLAEISNLNARGFSAMEVGIKYTTQNRTNSILGVVS